MENPIAKLLSKRCSIRLVQICVLVLLLGSITSAFAQNSDTQKEKELPLEKVYLHLDRSFYTAGEDIWFKAYLMDAREHTSNTLSEIVYVELIAPNKEVIAKRTLKTNTGSAAGDFKIPATSSAGTYSIRAYTNYMRNFGIHTFYNKEILVNTMDSPALLGEEEVGHTNNTIDVQFFPEGGYIINGFLNPIAFKAIDAKGKSIHIDGNLIDDLGKTVTQFTASHLGMGLFHFIPKQDRFYHAIVSHEGEELRFDLPKPQTSGVLMTVSNQEDFYKIELRATKDLKIRDYLLIGKQGGTVRFNLAVNANKQENSTIVKVVKDILHEGILELTLVDQNNTPIAERLVFHEKENGKPIATITGQKNAYEKREPVVMEIALDSVDLTDIRADISVSVSNLAVNATENNMTEIKTYLLLTSTLRGKIEQPGYYFYSSDPERQQHLDVLMRTQGWRQYVLEEEVVASSNYFLPEKGLTLSGKVVNAGNTTEPLTGSVSLTSNSATEMLQDREKTDEDGIFSFTNLNFTDTTNVLLSANVYYPKKKRNPTENYKIILDSVNETPSPSATSNPATPNFKNEGSLQTTKDRLAQFKAAYEKALETTLSFGYNDKTIALDEAFIAAKKKPKVLDKFERKRKGMPYKEPSQTIDFDDIDLVPGQNALFALQGRVAGLSMGRNRINIRGSSNASGSNMPLILLDGIPIPTEPRSLDEILPLTGNEVDFIDIIKGPRAAIYGSRAANGVVAVYTKNGTESSSSNTRAGGPLNFEHPGFSNARKFYSPKYDAKQEGDKDLDVRATLYRQPYIKLNANGKNTISFYAGDISGVFKVVLEGMTSKGIPIHSNMNFIVE